MNNDAGELLRVYRRSVADSQERACMSREMLERGEPGCLWVRDPLLSLSHLCFPYVTNTRWIVLLVVVPL